MIRPTASCITAHYMDNPCDAIGMPKAPITAGQLRGTYQFHIKLPGMTCNFLEHYDTLEVIGHGAFGIVRKVRRKSDGMVTLFSGND